MNIDLIIQKGQSGEILNSEEKEALMFHALELLKFIEIETLASINRAESEYKKAA